MSVQDFATFCANRSALLIDWKSAIYLKNLDPTSNALHSKTLGEWLAFHNVDYAKTPYWKLCLQESLVNYGLHEVKQKEDEMHSIVELPTDAERGGEHLYVANARDPRILELRNELFSENTSDDHVLECLFKEWVQTNLSRLFSNKISKTISGDLDKVNQINAQSLESSKVVQMRLHFRNDPSLRLHYLLFKQANEALQIVREYLFNFVKEDTTMIRMDSTSISKLDAYYREKEAIDLLIGILRYAKSKHVGATNTKSSVVAFFRKGSVFQYLWNFAQNIFTAVCIDTNGSLEFLEINAKKSKPPRKSSNLARSRTPTGKVKSLNPLQSNATKKTLHHTKNKQIAKSTKKEKPTFVRGRKLELVKHPCNEEHRALLELVSNQLSRHQEELQRQEDHYCH